MPVDGEGYPTRQIEYGSVQSPRAEYEEVIGERREPGFYFRSWTFLLTIDVMDTAPG